MPANLTYCYICHPTSVNPDGTHTDGGTHLNGVKDSSFMHGDYSSPAVHGPAYFDYLVGATTVDCKRCHGANLDGGTVGPSCTACHAANGWTGWQTNCSFCHGAKTAAAKAGYALATHPTWSAPARRHLAAAHRRGRPGPHRRPPDPPDRHHAAASAPAFSCATCHAVPADLSHIGGSAARATVALSGAGQASLPASLGSYNQATGTCATYCHGTSASPAWSTTGVTCGACHGLAAAGPHPTRLGGLTACAGCHPETMNADGTINLAGGKHLNGTSRPAAATATSAPPPPTARPSSPSWRAAGALDCGGCHGATYDGGSGPVLQRLPRRQRLDRLADQLLLLPRRQDRRRQGRLRARQPPDLVGPARRRSRSGSTAWPSRPAPAPTRST